MSDERKAQARQRLMAALEQADAEAVEQAAEILERAEGDGAYDPVAEGKAAAARTLAKRKRSEDAFR